MITWRYPSGPDCSRGFRVEFAATNERKFESLNEGRESIMRFYDRQSSGGGNGTAAGWYRVKAVDFWGKAGPYSAPEKYEVDEN